MGTDPRHAIDDLLLLTARHLEPVIDRQVQRRTSVENWPRLLQQRDKAQGRKVWNYDRHDLWAQLSMFRGKFGKLGYLFDDHSHELSQVSFQLRTIRNRWAHQEEFAMFEVNRAVATAMQMFLLLTEDEAVEALAKFPIDQTVELPQFKKPAPRIVEEPEVKPEPGDLVRDNASDTPDLGDQRDYFEPWESTGEGDPEIWDNASLTPYKFELRALAETIVDFEGPIHEDRLLKLLAGEFGKRMPRGKTKRKIQHQIRNADAFKDEHNFYWPEAIDPSQWEEFRPNDSNEDRPFEHISPVEISNALNFAKEHNPNTGGDELLRATLRIFGMERLVGSRKKHFELVEDLQRSN